MVGFPQRDHPTSCASWTRTLGGLMSGKYQRWGQTYLLLELTTCHKHSTTTGVASRAVAEVTPRAPYFVETAMALH